MEGGKRSEEVCADSFAQIVKKKVLFLEQKRGGGK